jgi:hypothetical protein
MVSDFPATIMSRKPSLSKSKNLESKTLTFLRDVDISLMFFTSSKIPVPKFLYKLLFSPLKEVVNKSKKPSLL